MSKAVIKKENNEVAVAESLDSWGQSNMSSKDLIVSKILPMQMMSKKVIDQAAAFGELRDTVNNEKFGDFANAMEFVPFHMEKVFIESEVVGNKKNYLGMVPITTANENLPYEDVRDGKKISRDYTINFYCVLPKLINPELASSGGGTLPYIISFRRTSLRAGKKVATQAYASNAAMKKPPAATVMSLSSVKTTNDEGTYSVLDTKASRLSSPEELATAFFWFKAMKSMQLKVDDSDLTEEHKATASTNEPSEF
jgi:hypothetical protein